MATPAENDGITGMVEIAATVRLILILSAFDLRLAAVSGRGRRAVAWPVASAAGAAFAAEPLFAWRPFFF
ncbi:MAG: hypothetical protein ACLPNY_02730, partial [Roseiarcus sp.]